MNAKNTKKPYRDFLNSCHEVNCYGLFPGFGFFVNILKSRKNE